MAWSYSGDPDSSALDAIRFLIGDTDTNDQLLANEEITWTNSQVTGSTTSTDALYTVAYRCMVTIASKFSRLADQSIGDMKVDMSQKAEGARLQAKELKALAQSEGGTPTPYAGGITVTDKDIDRENSDLVQPSFSQGQFANTTDYGAGPSTAPPGGSQDEGWAS
jgi:hypothetical protein|tara:strand:+ start:4454 stop:4948 length:495 start_codon:yes stop_codon:yes gene_type:complete